MTDALAALQATPSASTGAGPSPLALGLVLVVLGWLVQTQTSVDLVGLVPSFGGPSSDGDESTNSGVLDFVTSINGLAIGFLTLLAALILGGAIDVPTGTGVPFVVALELVAAALILDELGGLNVRLFGLVVLSTTVLGLSALGEPVLASVANSPVGPLAILAIAAILWRALGDRTRKIVVRGKVEDGGDG